MGIKPLHVISGDAATLLLKQLPWQTGRPESLDLLSILDSHHIKSRATSKFLLFF